MKVNDKLQHLGRFNTPEQAFNAYKPFKEALCKQLALKWQTEIDSRLFNAMMNWSVKSVLRKYRDWETNCLQREIGRAHV